MAVEIIGKMKPKNNGSFKLVDTIDVAMPDGSSLQEFLDNGEGSAATPLFDLAALGLPVIQSTGGTVSVEADTSAIMAALDIGAVKFDVVIGAYGVEVPVEVLTTSMGSDEMGGYHCGCVLAVNDVPYIANFAIMEGSVTASVVPLQKKTTVPATIDMTSFEESGQIVETYADSTSKTTTMEFDADGNPIKITDGDGNVTTLTW